VQVIAISSIIGATISSADGEIRNTAGPGSVLTAWAVFATTAICVAVPFEVILMPLMWPVPNAMVKNVKVFVDWCLAIVVGLVYWFVRASSRVSGLILTHY
jgi:amino acid permease